MARKRINYKVLGIVVGGMAFAGAAVFIAGKTLTHESPTVFADAGDVAMAQRKWVDAIRDYGKACQLTKSANADYLTRLGKAYRMQTPFDQDVVGKDRAAWEKALEVDPRYMPALSAELNFFVELAPLDGSAGAYGKIKELSERIEALDPNQLNAVAYGPISVVQAWLGNIEQSDLAIDQAIDKMNTILEKETAAASQPAVAPAKTHQVNPELPYYIAMAHWKRGLVALQNGKQTLAEDNFDQASALIDKLIKQQDQNAALAYRAYIVYTQLARIDHRNDAADREKAQTALDRARALVDDKDPLYIDINLAAADAVGQRGDPQGAIDVLRGALAIHPNNAPIALTLAKRLASLNPPKRAEAIDLLNAIATADVSGEGNEGVRGGITMRGMRNAVAIQLATLRIQEVSTLKDPAARDAMMKDIESAITRLRADNESGPVLRLVGEYQVLKGQNVEAIQSFSRALQLMERLPNSMDRAQLKFELAHTYLSAQQTGPAIDVLKSLVNEIPNAPGPRLLLAQAYFHNGDHDNAEIQYNKLKQMKPDDPEIIRLGLMLMSPTDQKAHIEEEYAKLTETTTRDKYAKAQAAIAINRVDEAARLLQSIHDAEPKNIDATRFLAKMYNQLDQKPKAIQVVNETLAAVPNDPTMKLMLAALDKNALSAADLNKAQLDALSGIKDDVQRELAFARFALDHGNRDEALAHLKKADAASPNNPDVTDNLFQFYIADKKLDEANALLPKLASMNRDQAGGKLFLIRYLLAKGDVQTAVQTAQEITRTLPEFAQSWLVYGQALQTSGRFEEARSQYVQALAKQSNNVDALKGVIVCDTKLGKPDDAHRYIQAGSEAWPNDPTFKELELSWQMSYGDPEIVVPVREAAVKAHPDSPQACEDLGVAYMRTCLVKRQTDPNSASAKDYAAKAWTTFNQAKDKWPDDPRFYAFIAELALTGNGDLSSAETSLKALTQRGALQDKGQAWSLLADFYQRCGKFDLADPAFKQACDLADKNNINPRLAYVGFLEQRGRYDDALAVLDPISNVPGIIGQKSQLLLRAGRFPAAETLIQSALKDHPTDASLMDLMAVTYINTNRFDQARQYVDKAIAIAPNDLLAVYNRGLINLKSPHPDITSAVRDLTAVRDAAPDNLDARQALAEAMRRNNDNDGAIRELEASLALAPGNTAVRATLVEWYSGTNPPRYDDAQRLIHDAEIDPKLGRDPQWFRLETSLAIARGDTAKAVLAAQKLYAAAPNDAGAIHLYLGTLTDAKQYQTIIDETDKLIAARKEAWWIHQLRGVARRNLAAGDKNAAMAEFEIALRQAQEAKDENGASEIVRTIASTIGVDEAIKSIADRAKTDSRWKIFAALLYQTKGDTTTALSTIEAALADNTLPAGDRVNALRLAGSMYLTPPNVDRKKAIATYTEILKTAKNDVASMNNLACTLLDDGRPQDALQYSQQAYDYINSNGIREPLIMDTHGWTLIQNGRVAEGINILLQAVDLRSFFDVHYHLGEGYLLAKPPLVAESVREFKIASDLLARSGSPDPASKAKVDAGLKKATDLVNADQKRAAAQSAAQASPAVP